MYANLEVSSYKLNEIYIWVNMHKTTLLDNFSALNSMGSI